MNVIDTTPPVITCAGPKTIDCAATVVFDTPTFSDNCDPNPVLSIISTVGTAGSCVTESCYTRTWRVTDCAGNFSECSQTICKHDATPPVLTCHADTTVACTSAVAFTPPQVTDNCDPNPTVVILSTVATPGVNLGDTVYTRTWQATDCAGNASAQCSQKITRLGCPVGEGCTPGFWKNHLSLWDGCSDATVVCIRNTITTLGAPYSYGSTSPCTATQNGLTGKSFWNIFGLDIVAHPEYKRGLSSTLTMQQAINLGGGGFSKLARHGIAGLLSSCALSQYPFTSTQILQMVHDAFVNNTPEPTATQIAAANDVNNCPLGATSTGQIIQQGSEEEVNSASVKPTKFALHTNYPNPFNPTTSIKFDLPEQSVVRLSVFNILGQEVAVLVNGVVEAGFREVEWNTTTGNGVVLPSGIYLYRIQATSLSSDKEFTQINKMVLMK
ncbi:MAG: T9SS type A sorting domain-containing protein [Ignavibacteriae bacterium]|nr:T9SS type A sorting domain-containing protein [Ignavibacteriota bacterium]